MYDTLRKLLRTDEFTVEEQFEILGRHPRHGAIPRFLFNSGVGHHLQEQAERHGWQEPLWSHQAQALNALGRGENVVLSTGTASGKSLVFRSIAFHKSLLNPGSRVLVFYPLKALAADQIRGWREMAQALELGEGIIGRIDGSVAVKDREDVIQGAHIVTMTPDVCHAWLMSRLSLPLVRDFLRRVSTVVMDEAHTLEGVFGSNFAFLFRRLIAARNHLLKEKGEEQPLQLVAATATIKNPGEHLSQLVGSKFTAIDHVADAAQQHERIVAHISCRLGEEHQVAKALHDRVLGHGNEGGFITFLDSRKGVEGLTVATQGGSRDLALMDLLGDAEVLPYRAGYDAGDRQEIERRLQSKSLRGIISTSALELGIDISHLTVGFNIGVPGTRKAYRQRLGRIGRNGPGAFVVIAPEHAFRRFGTTFREYHDMSVEPSYLYLDNRFMQFAHGRCLAVELESLGAPSATPPRVAWPRGFIQMHAAARPGGSRAPEYDAIAALGGDTPHYGYPLRNVGELNYQIKRGTSGDSFGQVSQLQALRECYPGATYLHLTRPYEVVAWHTSTFEPFIRVKPCRPGRSTRPRITTWINATTAPTDIQGGHFISGENGFLVECLMQITERVEGYVDGSSGHFHSYQDLQQKNPNMRARSRNFRTSGVVLCIERDWFKNGSVKRAFADRLREVFVREYSISSQDVGSAGTNISVRSADGSRISGGCIAIYDETYGSLRLTERLYIEFEHVLTRLSNAVAVDPIDDEDDFEMVVAQVRSELETFSNTVDGARGNEMTAGRTGYEQVFSKGSRVCYQVAGQMAIDVEVIQPTIIEGKLMYQVTFPQRGAKRWIAASDIEPSANADAWDYTWWNRDTETYAEPPKGEES